MLRRLRDVSDRPVIVLSARHDSGDKVRALDSGADDYVTKPFGMDELLARVRTALRHRTATSSLPVRSRRRTWPSTSTSTGSRGTVSRST